jgi:peroxiredoxin
MAQLRQDYPEFVKRGAKVVIIGPEKRDAFVKYWQAEAIPYIGLPDSLHDVAKAYHQEVNLFKLGRMPALMLIDRQGYIRYEHRGESMADIVPDEALLVMIDALDSETVGQK